MTHFFCSLKALFVFALLFLFTDSPAQQTADHWSHLKPYFQTPKDYKGQLGDFRSPLRFYDGRPVANAKDWQKRKVEIRTRWQELMGPWPELLTKQQFKIVSSQKRENFTQHTVRFFWMPGVETEGYLLVPESQSSQTRPAVISVFYEPETAVGLSPKPNRDFAYQLAKRGFITLSIGTKEASLAHTFSLYYPSISDAKVQPLSMLGYAAANAWHALANFKGVDAGRIGIVGHSFGGKWAMFASCLFDKFACAAWSDPGIVFREDRESTNYWEPWYLGYHPKPWRKRGLITPENPAFGLYLKLREEGYNLQELHALMAPRPFLVSGGAEDAPSQWVALNHAVAVNKLLGYENRVGMTNRPLHEPNVESNNLMYSFFEHFLKKGKK